MPPGLLSAVTEWQTHYPRLLTQRLSGSLHNFGNLIDGCFCFRVRLERLQIFFGIQATSRGLLCFLGLLSHEGLHYNEASFYHSLTTAQLLASCGKISNAIVGAVGLLKLCPAPDNKYRNSNQRNNDFLQSVVAHSCFRSRFSSDAANITALRLRVKSPVIYPHFPTEKTRRHRRRVSRRYAACVSCKPARARQRGVHTGRRPDVGPSNRRHIHIRCKRSRDSHNRNHNPSRR